MPVQRLNVLVAGVQSEERSTVELIAGLGHDVHAAELDSQTTARQVRASGAEIVVVPRGRTGGAALRLIGALTHEASFPVVAASADMDVEWLERAVAAGASGAVVGCDAESFRIALRVAWQRSSDYRSLQEAFERRATIEQAKGLLMARYSISGDRAFELLRDHSQKTNRKLVDVASALLKAHIVLSGAVEEGSRGARVPRPTIGGGSAENGSA
jgi:AmiR/NasT family two-component response regulator